MKRILTCMACCLATTAAMAQETYESAQVATADLNGTARYIGMGGAMEALGADISTISTNPAGIGLFRKSWFGISGGLTSQQGDEMSGATDFEKQGVTNVDFNQVGIVFATGTANGNTLNFGFNYHKSRNFNQIVNATNTLDDASAAKSSFISIYNCETESYMEGMNTDLVLDPLGGYSSAERYRMMTQNSGYVANFDFNLSGSINNQVFLGLTVGYKYLNYHNGYYYEEDLVNAVNAYRGKYSISDERYIHGSGYDIKAGAIFRPLEDSPFRLGFYIHTPTWYTLTCEGGMYGTSRLNDIAGYENNIMRGPDYDYDCKIVTPWRFGLSLGHTVNNKFAFGATYEYADYSSIKNKVVTGEYWDWDYNYWYDDYEERLHNEYSNDISMNRNTERSLKAVHTIKVGAELKPVPEVAIRLGYNYVSPIYNANGSKDNTIDGYYSNGAYFANYGYTNWKDTHRVTFGLGFSLSKSVTLDLSYQYAVQKDGEYYPFQTDVDVPTYQLSDGTYNFETNVGNKSLVQNNRHQVNVTLGCRL